jgi:hypothetical protein
MSSTEFSRFFYPKKAFFTGKSQFDPKKTITGIPDTHIFFMIFCFFITVLRFFIFFHIFAFLEKTFTFKMLASYCIFTY